MHFTILRFERIDSTNTEAASQARRGADEGLCVIARQQTMGRGRHGRVWVSPADAGLYFSVVLRPRLEMRFLPLLTLMAAVAVCDALGETYALPADVKWVNDILVREKKICGILAETIETPRGLAVVLGIGINLRTTSLPDDLRATATSVEDETARAASVDEILPALTAQLARRYEILNETGGAALTREEWIKRSSYAFGKTVRIVTETETFHGTTRGVEESGALRVETESGAIRIVHAGDVINLRRD